MATYGNWAFLKANHQTVSSFNRDAEEMAGGQLAITIDMIPASSGDERVRLVPASSQCNVDHALVFGVR